MHKARMASSTVIQLHERRSTMMTRAFRSFLVFYNSFVLIISLALLGLSTYVYATLVSDNQTETELRILLLIVLTIAGLEASIAIFGMTGAIFESQACLLCYACFLFLFSACQIVATVLGGIHSDLVIDFMGKGARGLARIVDRKTKNSGRPVSLEAAVTDASIRRCFLMALISNGALIIVNFIFIALALTVHRSLRKHRQRTSR